MLTKIILFSLLEDLFEQKKQLEIWNFLEKNQEQLQKKGLFEFLPKVFLQDVTSSAIFTDKMAVGTIYAKQKGVFFGQELILQVFGLLDPKAKIEILVSDGLTIKKNEQIAKIKSSLFCLLIAERTVLNFLCHLSGVATKTAKFVNLVKNTNVKILDSRKTIPGMRNLQKAAVKSGGGQNHRFGLYDEVLIKNNHIDSVGDLEEVIQKIIQKHGQKYPILVETRNLKEVEQALKYKNKLERIMLDNMDLDLTKKALNLIKDQLKTEYTGNVNLKNISKIAKIGIDFISIGGNLTMETDRLDLSFRIKT
jgi:nicotinate-nucleotide pyrophosphorylase (carboxylating)